MINILGVSGSMRENSNSAILAKYVLEEAQSRGAQTRFLDLNELDLPMFRDGGKKGEVHKAHPGRGEADDAVRWANAFVLVTPDYHGSMSGAMKNFLDHYWSEFAGCLFSYGCVSHEKGLTVMDQMRTAIRQCYGWSMPYGLSVCAADFEGDAIANQAARERAEMIARDCVVYGSLIKQQFQSDLHCDEHHTFAARYRV